LVYIKEVGIDDALLTIMLRIYQEPQLFPIFEQTSKIYNKSFGTYITEPVEIDGTKGSVVYNYPEGDPAVNPLKSMGGSFVYYPSSWLDGEDLKGIYEVYADTFGAATDDSRVMPIVQEVMRTIHLSGV
jgi:hypothetical protein